MRENQITRKYLGKIFKTNAFKLVWASYIIPWGCLNNNSSLIIIMESSNFEALRSENF